jgi:phage terminase small subunit
MALSGGPARVWAERVEDKVDPRPADVPVLEAWCTLIARLDDARSRIEKDGMLVKSPKGESIPHPMLAIERGATADLAKMQPVISRLMR